MPVRPRWSLRLAPKDGSARCSALLLRKRPWQIMPAAMGWQTRTRPCVQVQLRFFADPRGTAAFSPSGSSSGACLTCAQALGGGKPAVVVGANRCSDHAESQAARTALFLFPCSVSATSQHGGRGNGRGPRCPRPWRACAFALDCATSSSYDGGWLPALAGSPTGSYGAPCRQRRCLSTVSSDHAWALISVTAGRRPSQLGQAASAGLAYKVGVRICSNGGHLGHVVRSDVVGYRFYASLSRSC